MQTINITPEQVVRAAQAGVKLINDDSRVNIPPSMAVSGDIVILNSILNALASGQAILGNPPKMTAPEKAPDKVPEKVSDKE